ncbi:hypothetical protein [Caballeronia sp. LZ035]|uniref:hypothetical protein n=1 Tax=Caballeronia sp. LZ035 TaxID=3038568 RepID=UPI002858FE0B|nr:hypothetical protein [Caballeronia sp. LZ035]MDR5763035.1 hypothetical protein [Caballeronia sp. LZ035]
MKDNVALQKERSTLEKADADIEQACLRVEQQRTILRMLEIRGHDMVDAAKLLETFLGTVEAMRLHRTAIIHEIERLQRD